MPRKSSKKKRKPPPPPKDQSALELYHFGRRSLDIYPERLPYDCADDVTPAGLNPQTHRDARLLANAVTLEKMQDMLRLCRELELEPRRTMFIRLLAADPSEWPMLIRWMASPKPKAKPDRHGKEPRRSIHDLTREILLRYPSHKRRKRHTVGRRPTPVVTVEELTVELRRLSDHILRRLDPKVVGALALPPPLQKAAAALKRAARSMKTCLQADRE